MTCRICLSEIAPLDVSRNGAHALCFAQMVDANQLAIEVIHQRVFAMNPGLTPSPEAEPDVELV